MKSDLEKLQGKWVQVGYERDGVKNPIDAEDGWNPVTEIHGNRFSVAIADGTSILSGSFKLNEHSKPKAIDWIDEAGIYASGTCQ